MTPAAAPVTPAPPADKVKRNYFLGAFVAVLVVGSFLGGFFAQDLRRPKPAPEPTPTACEGRVLNRDEAPPFAFADVDFGDFWEIWKQVKTKHVGPPPTDVEMFYGAIGGMVASLQDPYSVFFDPEVATKFAEELSGTFEGIGAEIGIKQERLSIIAPLPGTPAEQAGLKAKDWIVAIDDADTAGMAVEEAVSRIRGPKGTEVVLLIQREGFREPQEFKLIRNTIVVDSVTWKTVEANGKKVAVIALSRFNEDTAARFSEAVRAVLLENPDGLVLDLRNNPGGYLDAAVEIAGDWIHHDVVVREKFSDGSQKDYVSDGLARLAGLPTVALVNGGSASASEIVAGALQDYGIAKIIGEQTFGKGSVQDYSEFTDGSALKLTVALWYTPKNRSIDKDGIAPDEVIKLTPEDFQQDRDPQLDRALDTLTLPPEALAPLPPAPADEVAPPAVTE